MKRASLTALGLLAGLAGPPLAADEAPAKPRVWAVVVGVDRYDDQLIPPCATAIRDARAVADWFARTAGWGRDHVLHLDERGAATHGKPEEATRALRPTRENLDWALAGWLGHRAPRR